MIVAMYWLLFFLTLEAYFGVFSFKRKGKINHINHSNNSNKSSTYNIEDLSEDDLESLVLLEILFIIKNLKANFHIL